MEMNASGRETLLSGWIGRSSGEEMSRHNRAVRVATDAVEGCSQLDSANVVVHVKGSCPNNANVRRESGVDIAVECQDFDHFAYSSKMPRLTAGVIPRSERWTPESVFRAAVEVAMRMRSVSRR